MKLADQLKRFVGPLQKRIMGMWGKALIKAVIDTGQIQLLKIDLGNGEVRTGLERAQQYGFTSHPLEGAQSIAVFMGGNRDHGIVLNVDDGRYRIALQPGEVGIYNNVGDKVVLKANGNIEVDATAKVIVRAATGIELNGAALLALAGLVTQVMPCAYTGGPHPMGSTTVKATP